MLTKTRHSEPIVSSPSVHQRPIMT